MTIKFAHIYGSFYKMHGATKWLLVLSSCLARKGFESTIHCVNFDLDIPYWFKGSIKPMLPRQYLGKELSGGKKLLFTTCQLFLVFFLPLKLKRPDCIVYHAEQSVWAGFLGKVLFPRAIHVYYCYQPPRELYDLNDRARKQFGVLYQLLTPLLHFYKVLDRWIVRRMDHVLVWSEEYENYVRSIYGDLRYHRIPAGVDFNFIENAPNLEKEMSVLRERYELGGAKVLLVVSNLSWKKNIDLFVRLLERLKKSGNDAIGVVIGEGPERASLETLAKELSVSDRVRFLGYVAQEELPYFFHIAEALYFLEPDGAWTMATIEAGAARKPAVVAPGGSMATLVRNGETGFVLRDLFDGEELFEKSLRLLNEESLVANLGTANYKHSIQFSVERCIGRFIDEVVTSDEKYGQPHVESHRLFGFGSELSNDPNFSLLERFFIRLFGAPEIGAKIRWNIVLPFIQQQYFNNCLDAGCGRGYFSFGLSKIFPNRKFLGVDISEDKIIANRHIGVCIRRENLRFHEADLLSLKEGSRFDLVLSVDNLEHVEDDVRLLKNLRGLLSPHGRLLIHVPRRKRKYFFRSSHAYKVLDHVREGYEPEELSEKLGMAGYRVVSIRGGYNFFQTLANELGTMCSKRLWLYAAILPFLSVLARFPERYSDSIRKVRNSIIAVAEAID